MRVAVATMLCLILLACPRAAPGQPESAAPAYVFYSLNADGSGHLLAGSYFVPAPASTWSWEACAGSSTTVCTPFASGSVMDTGTASPGTFFVARSNTGQVGVSPVWFGPLRELTPPGIYGSVRANTVVAPIPGTWAGGWGMALGDDEEQLSACPNARGTACTAITAPGYVYACGAGAVVDPVFTGWYLRVANRHVEDNGPAAPLPVIIPTTPYGAPVWPASATVSVAIVGRIAAANRPRATWCGGPPLPPGADPHHPRFHCPKSSPFGCDVATLSPRGIADVWCVFACRAVVRLRHGDRELALKPTRASTAPSTAPLTVGVPRSAVTRLGRGRAIESVYSGRTLIARREISLP